MNTSKATGYSLWLVPKRNDETFLFLKGLIDKVAAEYKTISFDPHVTLLGGINESAQNVYEKTSRLATKLSPYEIKLGKIGSNRSYFQVLFSKVIETNPVIHANTVAQHVFGMNSDKYFPHLSVAYGDFSKDQINFLKTNLGKYSLPEKDFVVEDVELWSTEGSVNEWYKIETFSLVKS